MPQIISEENVDAHIEAERQRARENLSEITARSKAALAEAGISRPVFLLVPSTRNSIVVVGTPDDVPDPEWHQISDLVQSVVRDVMEYEGTASREIACAEIRSGAMEATEGNNNAAV